MIKDECAGYYVKNNYCWYKDKMCIFYSGIKDDNLPFCKYFEKGVLPIKPNLEVDYKEERDLFINRVVVLRKKCERCGEKIEANSNRQKYCDKCKKIKRKEQVKLAVKKVRDKDSL